MVKNQPASAVDTRDVSLIPGSGRFPGVGHDTSFQYPCLENSMDRGAWQAIKTRLAKKFVWFLVTSHRKKTKQIFWPTQHFISPYVESKKAKLFEAESRMLIGGLGVEE